MFKFKYIFLGVGRIGFTTFGGILRKGIPNVYDGDLEEEEDFLQWLVEQLEKDEIEDVTDEMLDKLIAEGKTLAVLFCKCCVRLVLRHLLK